MCATYYGLKTIKINGNGKQKGHWQQIYKLWDAFMDLE